MSGCADNFHKKCPRKGILRAKLKGNLREDLSQVGCPKVADEEICKGFTKNIFDRRLNSFIKELLRRGETVLEEIHTKH
jgi:hypothetical protein